MLKSKTVNANLKIFELKYKCSIIGLGKTKAGPSSNIVIFLPFSNAFVGVCWIIRIKLGTINKKKYKE